MAHRSGSPLRDAIYALRVTASQLSGITGVSKRTAQRWFTGQSQPAPSHYTSIAKHVHPIDRDIAADLAQRAGTTLIALGLESPAPPPVPSPAPLRADLVIDSVVCVAAEAISVMPHAVRPALLAAFARAHLLGLTVEAMEAALRKAAAT